jgi:two-component system, NarL family, nitrate/nitrite response regulator NarL
MPRRPVAGKSRVTFVVADNHPVFRAGVRRLLESEPGYQVVAETADVLATVAAVRSLRPNILMLGLALPLGSGFTVLSKLHNLDYLSIIVLTAELDTRQLQRAIKGGARGVILKGSPAKLILRCIEAVLEGELWLDPACTSAERVSTAAAAFELTSREKEIVVKVASGATNRDMALELGISEVTVKRHLSNIFDKVGVENRVELAVFALSHGVQEP